MAAGAFVQEPVQPGQDGSSLFKAFSVVAGLPRLLIQAHDIDVSSHHVKFHTHYSTRLNLTPADAVPICNLFVYEDHHTSILGRAMHNMKFPSGMFHGMSNAGFNHYGNIYLL